jgi:kynurenine formamidase
MYMKKFVSCIITLLLFIPLGVMSAQNQKAISRKDFENVDVKGKAVLVNTGWDKHWKTDRYFVGHPFLTRDAAQYLVDSGASLIGVDSLNIDDTDDGHRPGSHSVIRCRNTCCGAFMQLKFITG